MGLDNGINICMYNRGISSLRFVSSILAEGVLLSMHPYVILFFCFLGNVGIFSVLKCLWISFHNRVVHQLRAYGWSHGANFIFCL